MMAPKPEKDVSAALRMLGRTLKRFVCHNWPMKLTALIGAVVLWAGLITQDATLTREKIFTDVMVNVSGSDTLKRNGYVVITDLTSLPPVTVRANVPQLQYNSAAVSAYNTRIDLSRIREAGVQTVKLSTTNSSTYGSVVDVTPDSVEIEVQEYITRYRIPVSLVTTGSVREGFYAGSASMDPPLIAVSGPRSLVDKIYRAEAVLDLSSLPPREGTIRSAAAFQLYAIDGTVMDSSLLEVTSESVLVDSVVVEQSLYPSKKLAVSTLGAVTGEPADGYRVKSVTFTPDVVTAAGKSESLSLLNTLYADVSIDLTGRTESFIEQIKVRKPGELVWMSTDTVTVAVELEPVISEKAFSDHAVLLRNVPSGHSAKLRNNKVSVIITGELNWLNTLRSSSVMLYCDLTGLSSGSWSLPVSCMIVGSDGHEYSFELSQASADVVITDK